MDAKVRTRREADRTEKVKQELENRIQLCKRAENRDFGKDVQKLARAVLAETGGEYTPTAVQRIVTRISLSEREKREAKVRR
jgi:hypothetical protein